MDKDKLSTAAKNYTDKVSPLAPYTSGMVLRAFHACADWLFTQPLGDRLTPEETEKIRAIYAKQTFRHDPDRDLSSIVVDQVLTEIFGAEFFTDKKDEQ